MKKYVVLVILLLIIVLSYNYVYQSHRNIETESAQYTITADSLIDEFLKDAVLSEQKYLNQTIQVTGIVTDYNEKSVTLNDNVFCQFNELLSLKPHSNKKISIKGRFIGFDDLLEELKMDQCIVIPSK